MCIIANFIVDKIVEIKVMIIKKISICLKYYKKKKLPIYKIDINYRCK